MIIYAYLPLLYAYLHEPCQCQRFCMGKMMDIWNPLELSVPDFQTHPYVPSREEKVPLSSCWACLGRAGAWLKSRRNLWPENRGSAAKGWSQNINIIQHRCQAWRLQSEWLMVGQFWLENEHSYFFARWCVYFSLRRSRFWGVYVIWPILWVWRVWIKISTQTNGMINTKNSKNISKHATVTLVISRVLICPNYQYLHVLASSHLGTALTGNQTDRFFPLFSTGFACSMPRQWRSAVYPNTWHTKRASNRSDTDIHSKSWCACVPAFPLQTIFQFMHEE